MRLASIPLKAVLASALDGLGVTSSRLRKYGASHFVILMYHRILPVAANRGCVQPGMYVLAETLESHISYLKRHFELRPLVDIRLRPPRPSSRPACFLTFDDGWQDFYCYAYGVLAAHGVPATVFLPTEFIGSSKEFWTDRLAALFLKGRTRCVPRSACLPTAECGGEPHGARPASFRHALTYLMSLEGSFETRLEGGIDLLKKFRYEEIEEIISELSRLWGIDTTATTSRSFLNWQEVKEMARSGLVSFGSHTANHAILTGFEPAEEHRIVEELIASKEKLLAEGVVDPGFIPFSYPNGDYTERIVGLVRDTGYHLAVTTKHGWNHEGSDPFTMRRIAIHQDVSATDAMFGCRIAGLL